MQDAVESSRRESMAVSNKPSHSKPHPSKGSVSIAGIMMRPGIDPYADERECTVFVVARVTNCPSLSAIYAPTPRKEEVQAKVQ